MRLFVHELRYELRLYSRSRELAFFTFLLPMILYLLLGFAYGDDELQDVKGSDYLMTGRSGTASSQQRSQDSTIVLVIRREDGILKRLRSTPLPAPVYLTAVLVTTMIAFLVQAVVHRRGRDGRVRRVLPEPPRLARARRCILGAARRSPRSASA